MSISGYHHSMALNIVHCTRFRISPSTITSVVAGIYGRKMWFQSGCFPQVELGSFRFAENFFMYLREAQSFQKREKALCKTVPLAAMCLSWKKSNAMIEFSILKEKCEEDILWVIKPRLTFSTAFKGFGLSSIFVY